MTIAAMPTTASPSRLKSRLKTRTMKTAAVIPARSGLRSTSKPTPRVAAARAARQDEHAEGGLEADTGVHDRCHYPTEREQDWIQRPAHSASMTLT